MMVVQICFTEEELSIINQMFEVLVSMPCCVQDLIEYESNEDEGKDAFYDLRERFENIYA